MDTNTQSPNDRTLLFVYGTLKRGDVRAPLLDGQQFIGEARTAPRFRLYNTGDYPALIEAQRTRLVGRSIVGELWAVDETCLARLDVEEGVEEGLYERTAIDLMGEQTPADTYLYRHSVEGFTDCGECWASVPR